MLLETVANINPRLMSKHPGGEGSQQSFILRGAPRGPTPYPLM